MLVSIAVHAIFLCEQPAGSDDVFPNHPRFSWLCNRVAVATLLNISMCFVFHLIKYAVFVFSADLSFGSNFVCLRFFAFSSCWEAQASLCTVKGVASFSLLSTTFAVSTAVVCSFVSAPSSSCFSSSFVSAPFSSCFSSSFGTALKYSPLHMDHRTLDAPKDYIYGKEEYRTNPII